MTTPMLETALPIGPDFPIDLARRQLLVCLGVIAKQARGFLRGMAQHGAQNCLEAAQQPPRLTGIFLEALSSNSGK